MKIINRKEFLNLPSGVIFSKYEPMIFGDICIKGETLHNDFYCQRIKDSIDCNDSNEFHDILDSAEKEGKSFDIDLESEIRDGMFDENQLFVVWENEDIIKLINRLNYVN